MNVLGIDPVHDTRETFRALVDAMSRPGTVQAGPATPMDYAVVATLVDHEVGIKTDDEALRDALAAEGRLTDAPVNAADIVHVRGDTDERVREVRRGTLKEPSEGATVIYHIDELTEEIKTGSIGDGESELVNGQTTEIRKDGSEVLKLSGPGIPGTRLIGVAGLGPGEIDAIADAQSTVPRGIDIVLTTEQRVAAIPRSADMEVA